VCEICSFFIIAVSVAGKNRSCFLEEEGTEEHIKVFRAVRLQHILNDKPSLSTIEMDKIIPESKFLICGLQHE
jgi:hypothetical protein